jgi:hypothetical protein
MNDTNLKLYRVLPAYIETLRKENISYRTSGADQLADNRKISH